MLAISLEKYDIVFTLLKYGATITIGDNEGITPLHLASQLDNLNLIIELIKNGADPFVRTKNGNLPLALAVNGGMLNNIKYLYVVMYGNDTGLLLSKRIAEERHGRHSL